MCNVRKLMIPPILISQVRIITSYYVRKFHDNNLSAILYDHDFFVLNAKKKKNSKKKILKITA